MIYFSISRWVRHEIIQMKTYIVFCTGLFFFLIPHYLNCWGKQQNDEPRAETAFIYLTVLGRKKQQKWTNKSKLKHPNITKSVTPYNPVAQPADMFLQICFLPCSIPSQYTGSYYTSSFSPTNKLSFVRMKIENLKGISKKSQITKPSGTACWERQ